jgi:heat shock protein 5
VVCAVVCPLSELLIMGHLGAWHYPGANVAVAYGGGMPSWVPWCYFFYTPAVGNLARYLWRIM